MERCSTRWRRCIWRRQNSPFAESATPLNVEDLSEEAERHIREGLFPAELELFDLLKKEKMTKAEEIAVKNAARALLKRLKEEPPKVLIQDWYQDTQSQHRVKDAVEQVLDRELPQTYERSLFKKVYDLVFQVIFESAFQGLGWAG